MTTPRPMRDELASVIAQFFGENDSPTDAADAVLAYLGSLDPPNPTPRTTDGTKQVEDRSGTAPASVVVRRQLAEGLQVRTRPAVSLLRPHDAIPLFVVLVRAGFSSGGHDTMSPQNDLTERMLAANDRGIPVCAERDHVWFGSFGVVTCAVCLLTGEEFVARLSSLPAKDPD